MPTRTYVSAVSLAEQSSTSATPTVATSITIPSADAASSTWAILWSCNHGQTNDATRQAIADLYHSTASTTLGIDSSEPQTQGTDQEWFPFSGAVARTFDAAPGDQTFQLRWYNESGTGTCKIRDCFIIAVKQTANDLAVVDLTDTNNTSTTPTTKITWTAPATATFHLFPTCVFQGTSTSTQVQIQVMLNGTTALWDTGGQAMSKDADNQCSFAKHIPISLTSGDVVTLRFSRPAGTGTNTLRYAAIIGFNASDMPASNYSVDNTMRSSNTVSLTERNAASTITITSPPAVEHLYFGSANLDRTVQTSMGRIELDVNTVGTVYGSIQFKGTIGAYRDFIVLGKKTPSVTDILKWYYTPVGAGTVISQYASVGWFQLVSSSSGTNYFATPSGTVTATGALIKQDGKQVKGVVTTSGVVKKDVTKTLAGTTTASGKLIKSILKMFTGSTTISGVMLRQTGKPLAGTITGTGALLRSIFAVRVGSVTPTGALRKDVTKPGLKGTTTPSGALTSQVLKLLALIGSITGSGALQKTMTKPLAGTTTSSGTLQKTTVKKLTGTSTITGALTSQVLKLLQLLGSITPFGTLKNAVNKTLVGASTSSGFLQKDVSKKVAGSSTPTGALAYQVLKQVLLSGSITAAGFLRKAVTKTLTGTSTTSGALQRTTAKTLRGSSTPTGALTQLISRTLALAGVITATGSLRKAITATKTGTTAPAGTLQKTTTKTVRGSTTASGTMRRDVMKLLAGTITAVGALKKNVTKTLAGTITALGQLITSGGTPLVAAIIGRLRTFGASVASTLGSRRATTVETPGGRTRTASGHLTTDGMITSETRREE